MVDILKPASAWLVETGGPFLAATEVTGGPFTTPVLGVAERLELDFGGALPLATTRMAVCTAEIEVAAASLLTQTRIALGLKILDSGVPTYQYINNNISGNTDISYLGNNMQGLDLTAQLGNLVAGLSGETITGYFVDFFMAGFGVYTVDAIKMRNCYLYLDDNAVVDVG